MISGLRRARKMESAAKPSVAQRYASVGKGSRAAVGQERRWGKSGPISGLTPIADVTAARALCACGLVVLNCSHALTCPTGNFRMRAMHTSALAASGKSKRCSRASRLDEEGSFGRSSRHGGRGCDGRAARETNVACADGEVVWSWRPDAGAKSVERSAGDGDNKARSHRGDHV